VLSKAEHTLVFPGSQHELILLTFVSLQDSSLQGQAAFLDALGSAGDPSATEKNK
jgi:hypothetical protein